MPRHRFVALPVCLLTALLIHALPARAAEPPADDKVIQAVDEIAKAWLARPGAVGLSIDVARGDHVILAKGYGLADAERQVAADAETMFRIGSVTKQFTAAAMMRLIEQGKLSLDDSITKYLPEYPIQGHAVTIRHLLNHTSGIKSYTDLGDEWVKLVSQELTDEQMLALFKDKPFDFNPGEHFKYNNSGYYLNGMIIEKITGKKYGEYLKEEFFKPLGMTHTRYDSNADVIGNRALGYDLRDGRLVNAAHIGMSQPGAAGGLISTAADLVKWQIALASGKVVSADSYKQMCTPCVLLDGSTSHYGFGLAEGVFQSRPIITHAGGIFGFNSVLTLFPQEQLHIAVISNSEPINSEKVADDIAYAALGIEKPQVKNIPMNDLQRAQYVGMYEVDLIHLRVRIYVEDGKLMAQATNQSAFQLLYQGDNKFLASFDNDVKIDFAMVQEGESIYAGGFTLHQGPSELTAQRMDK